MSRPGRAPLSVLFYLKSLLPAADWLRHYERRYLTADAIAGIVTAMLLVPQGVAFALLAGLPPQAGLYASIVGPLVYGLFGTSRTLSVGPVSVAAQDLAKEQPECAPVA